MLDAESRDSSSCKVELVACSGWSHWISKLCSYMKKNKLYLKSAHDNVDCATKPGRVVAFGGSRGRLIPKQSHTIDRHIGIVLVASFHVSTHAVNTAHTSRS